MDDSISRPLWTRAIASLLVAWLLVGTSACFFKSEAPRTRLAGEEEEAASAEENGDEGVVSELAEEGEPVEETPAEVPEHVLSGVYSFRLPASDLPVVMNERVLSWMHYFTTRGRPVFEKWLERRPLVEPMIRRVLKAYGLPQDLLFLAMIESGFNPKAYSRARASGPWQFIKGTGRLYGLRVNEWVDERRDPEKATDAAARHLRDLYEAFGDWNLAAAAYNAGQRKVERAIRRHGKRDYWDLISVRHPYLRSETRNYVPKMYAALILAKQPEVFGFSAPLPVLEKPYETVFTDDATDINVLARAANVSADEVKVLNPELRLWFTPPEYRYSVRVPYGTKDTFETNFAKIPDDERITFRQHVVGRGEALGSIARRYRTSPESIMKLNKLSSAKRIRVGHALIIPVRKGEELPPELAYVEEAPPRRRHHRSSRGGAVKANGRVLASASAPRPAGAKEVRHVVQSGETLWDLALRYKVSVPSIRTWNALRRSSRIYPGDTLVIYVKG